MYLLLIFLFFASAETRICNISEPIGSWLQKNKGPCDEINGHFILDASANKFKKKIFSTFSNLTRIEGCIKIKGYTGSKNISFFSKLEDVVCDEILAKEANLTDVIEVEGKNFKKMGFYSLKNVKGPGKIKIYYTPTQWKGHEAPCFSMEEMIFLAYHPQFHGKMPVACKIDDPCIRLDLQIEQYSFLDILPNCTTFFGLVSIVGAYDEEYLVGRFDNLKLIVGSLTIGCSLINRLDILFPKLEVVYPYYFNMDLLDIPPYIPKDYVYEYDEYGGWSTSGNGEIRLGFDQYNINVDEIATDFHSVQYLNTRINRFLTNWSIPTLLNIRPLDVGDADRADDLYYGMFMSRHYILEEAKLPERPQPTLIDQITFHRYTYLPDTVEDPCLHFPQFDSCDSAMTSENHRGAYALAFRIQRPLFVVKVFTVTTKAVSFLRGRARELAISEQKAAKMGCPGGKAVRFLGPAYHFLPQFESLYLLHPAIPLILIIFAASKHSALVAIVLLYLNIILSHSLKSPTLYRMLYVLTLTGFPILTSYISSQTYFALRGIRPLYSRESQRLLFIPFIMDINFAQDFTNMLPESVMIPSDSHDTLSAPDNIYEDHPYAMTGSDYRVIDFPFVSFGVSTIIFKNRDPGLLFIARNILPTGPKNLWQLQREFSTVCDIAMFIATVTFHVLKLDKISKFRGLSKMLILLYFQHSINRIRSFIHNNVLSSDYCILKDYDVTIVGVVTSNHWYDDISCYDIGEIQWKDGVGRIDLPIPPLMTKYQWDIVERLCEMLPYVSYLVVSYVCYKVVKFHGYLGTWLLIEEKKRREKEKTERKGDMWSSSGLLTVQKSDPSGNV